MPVPSGGGIERHVVAARAHQLVAVEAQLADVGVEQSRRVAEAGADPELARRTVLAAELDEGAGPVPELAQRRALDQRAEAARPDRDAAERARLDPEPDRAEPRGDEPLARRGERAGARRVRACVVGPAQEPPAGVRLRRERDAGPGDVALRARARDQLLEVDIAERAAPVRRGDRDRAGASRHRMKLRRRMERRFRDRVGVADRDRAAHRRRAGGVVGQRRPAGERVPGRRRRAERDGGARRERPHRSRPGSRCPPGWTSRVPTAVPRRRRPRPRP